ncbi:MAG TPA: DUF1592 domain-containing protein [Spongiibacteraceae bacterium]|nr:DUF1592 domain-containing protein [Spongiibacteraceae bacterium]
MRRLTEAQYRRSIADIFGNDIKIVGNFEPDLRVNGLLAEGSTQVSVTPNGLEQYESAARSIAEQVTDEAHWNNLVGCEQTHADPRAERCTATFFRRVGKRLYRRPLRDTEVATAVADTLAATKKLGALRSGMSATLAAMLTSPDFIFRIERTANIDDNNRHPDATPLDAWSRAARLSFLLWNTTPDDELLAAAQSGELITEAGLARQVERMMASPRFNDGVRAFFDDFLRLDGLNTLSKDATIYPAFSPRVAQDAREQTLRTISELLVNRRGSYSELFTTRRFAMNRTLGPLYDVPVATKDWSFYQFPDTDPRAGLLTQISLLALYSHPGRTSPTLRGKAIREILMCEEIPAPPANVNFSVVQDTNNPELRTTRERVAAHLNDDNCASCHKKTDPIGLGLEKFDGAGRFRALENNEAIDSSGELDREPFDGAAALGAALAKSQVASTCLVQSAYRYAVGRAILPREQSTIARYEQTFVGNEYRFIDLIRTIATDPQFYTVAHPVQHAAVADRKETPL